MCLIQARKLDRWGFAAVLSGAMLLNTSALAQAPQPEATAVDAADAPLPGQADRPTIDPETQPWFRSRESRVGVPATTVDLDPAILGPLPGQPAPTLHREGDFIVDQLGRLHPLSNSAIAFELIDEGEAGNADTSQTPDVKPRRVMVVQPCQRLQTMISVAEQQGGGVLFRVTGQVHTYRGVNYLLPTALTGYQSEDDEPIAEEGQADADQEATNADADEAGRETDTPGTVSEPDALDTLGASDDLDEATPESVGATELSANQDPMAMMDAMADELAAEATKVQSADKFRELASPVQPAAPPVGAGAAGGGAATRGSGPADRREGAFIVSRSGRLIRSADLRNVLFAFEADGADLAEPPIGVLPCRLREWMEDSVARRGGSQVFVVSGRVYRYFERDFFLPSVVKLRVDDDNLGG